MSDPIKPVQPPGVERAEGAEAAEEARAAEEAEGAAGAFQVEGAGGLESGEAIARTDALQASIREVAEDIRAGRVPDQQAASEAVIIRLVNLRFGHLNDAQRRRLLLHLHEVLNNDPQFQDRIERLLEVARV